MVMKASVEDNSSGWELGLPEKRKSNTNWVDITQDFEETCRDYIMQNTRLDEAQAGIKIARRNISSLRYADDTTLTTESEEELKSLLKVKQESEKAGLKVNIQETKVIASGPSLHGK